MAAILSHPFRLDPSGYAATVEQDSDAGIAEQVAVAILTRVGERELVPTFGIPGAAFAGLDRAALEAVLAVHGPPVTIEAVEVTYPTATTQQVEVSYG